MTRISALVVFALLAGLAGCGSDIGLGDDGHGGDASTDTATLDTSTSTSDTAASGDAAKDVAKEDTATSEVGVDTGAPPDGSATDARSDVSACTFPLVQEIFDRNCALSGCHVVGGGGPMPLTAGFSYKNIVGVKSPETPSMDRVTPGDALHSALYLKVAGSSPGHSLSAADLAILRKWIDDGACAK